MRRPEQAAGASKRRIRFSVNIYEGKGNPSPQLAAAAKIRRPTWDVRLISSFAWRIGPCDSLDAVIRRVELPVSPPRLKALPPAVGNQTIHECSAFVPLDQIYPNVAPVAGTVVAAHKAGVADLGKFHFVTERRCLKRIASLSHSLCTDLQMVDGVIFARDVPKHRCVNYGDVGHQFHRLCLPSGAVIPETEFFHLTELRAGPHRLLVASEVDGHSPAGEGVELKVGKLGGLSTWTQCLFAAVPHVVRGTSRSTGPKTWTVQRVDAFDADEMLSHAVKENAMETFIRVLSRIRACMREGRVFRLQREQRNIVCLELDESAVPLITPDDLAYLRARVGLGTGPPGREAWASDAPRAQQGRASGADDDWFPAAGAPRRAHRHDGSSGRIRDRSAPRRKGDTRR